MIINFKVPDAVFETYVKSFGLPRAYNVMRTWIETMKDIDPKDRYVMLGGDNRRAIEAVFETIIDTPEKLVRLVTRLNNFKIGDIQVNFTDDELMRLDQQAKFHGRTREVFMAEMATDIKNRMMETV